MKPTTPSVYLIAEPKLNWTEIKAYLDSLPNAEDGTKASGWLNRKLNSKIHDAQLLIEFMGRLCYRSWAPGLNANVKKVREDSGDYLENILKSQHGCYDFETEVLTWRGWKYWEDVSEDDLLATRRADGRLQYRKPTNLISYYHKGRMYRVESQGVDLLVTPDHKMLTCLTTTKEGRKKNNYSLIRAEELGQRSHAYIKTAWWSPNSHPTLSSDEAAFLGFAIGDGHVSDGYLVSFHLRRPRKIQWLKRLVKKLGWKITINGDHYRVWPTSNLRVDEIYNEYKEKVIPQYIFKEPEEVLEGLLDGLMQSDGHFGSTNDSYDTTSDTLAGQIQQLCLHVGIAANITYRYENRKNSYGNKPLTRLSILSRSLQPEVNKWSGCEGKTYWVDDWEGQVYCAEVPNNTLYVRRNGIPVWSGNSVLEHANFSFVFADVSRVFTHELVRHRAGVAISQESLRFVRLTDLGFRIPSILSGNYQNPQSPDFTERIINIVESLEDFQKDAAKEFGLDDEGVPFHYKKEVTSALRRLAPIGLSTTIGWSANVRTLRWVIENRTAPGAEEEIRYTFAKVGQLMKETCPLLFGDFEISEGAWVSKYRKV